MASHKIVAPVSGVLKWIALNNAKVQTEQVIATILLTTLQSEGEDQGERDVVTVLSSVAGSLKRVTKEGTDVKVGDNIAEVFSCSHPAVFRGLCVSCGIKMAAPTIESNKQTPHKTNFTMIGGQTIQLSQTEAKLTQSTKIATLLKNRKLALILDLDSTLLHATPYQPYPQNILDQVHSIQLEENGFILRHLVRVRPHLTHFLESCKTLFHMTIYTHGTRSYAEAIAGLIDPTGIYFGRRIVSRTDHPELGLEKCLSRLFLEDWSMAVVLDDRDEVWKKDQQSHVICIKPYLFFNQFLSRGKPNEINNAPGLASVESLLGKTSTNSTMCQVETTSSDENSSDQGICPPDVIPEIPKPDDVVEGDSSLLQSLETLKILHSKYYESSDRGDLNPNVGTILSMMRRSVLRGCHLSFSGLLPSQLPNPQSHKLWVMAKSLGATVSLQLNSKTTHLLTISLETEKSRECVQAGNVYLCNPDWLLTCHWHIKREDEIPFLLAPIVSRPRIDSNEEIDEIIQVERVKREREENSPTSQPPKRPYNRSDAGEYGVNYNSESESEDSSDSEDAQSNRPKKIQRLEGSDSNDSESDIDENWIDSIEKEIAHGSADSEGQQEDGEESEEDLGCRCENRFGSEE